MDGLKLLQFLDGDLDYINSLDVVGGTYEYFDGTHLETVTVFRTGDSEGNADSEDLTNYTFHEAKLVVVRAETTYDEAAPHRPTQDNIVLERLDSDYTYPVWSIESTSKSTVRFKYLELPSDYMATLRAEFNTNTPLTVIAYTLVDTNNTVSGSYKYHILDRFIIRPSS